MTLGITPLRSPSHGSDVFGAKTACNTVIMLQGLKRFYVLPTSNKTIAGLTGLMTLGLKTRIGFSYSRLGLTTGSYARGILLSTCLFETFGQG